MPQNPEPSFDAANMRWARWATDELKDLRGSVDRVLNNQTNIKSNQDSTLNMLANRLGNVAEGIQNIISDAVFDAGQVTSGVFPQSRLPDTSADRVKTGSLSIPGSGGFGGDLYSGGQLNVAGSSTIIGNETVQGNVFVPNSTTATVGYTVAYINQDGRLSRGASSIRFKANVINAPTLGDMFGVPFREFEMIGGDGDRKLGYIAEELVGSDMERFVVWECDVKPNGEVSPAKDAEGNPVPLSIDFIPLLMAQNQQLHGALRATTAKLVDIEARLTALEEN